MTMTTPEERLAERLAAATRHHVPRAERAGRISPTRDIACRSCGRWMRYGEAGPWRHTADGTLACIDPDTLRPYTQEEPTVTDTDRCANCGATRADAALRLATDEEVDAGADPLAYFCKRVVACIERAPQPEPTAADCGQQGFTTPERVAAAIDADYADRAKRRRGAR